MPCKYLSAKISRLQFHPSIRINCIYTLSERSYRLFGKIHRIEYSVSPHRINVIRSNIRLWKTITQLPRVLIVTIMARITSLTSINLSLSRRNSITLYRASIRHRNVNLSQKAHSKSVPVIIWQSQQIQRGELSLIGILNPVEISFVFPVTVNERNN